MIGAGTAHCLGEGDIGCRGARLQSLFVGTTALLLVATTPLSAAVADSFVFRFDEGKTETFATRFTMETSMEIQSAEQTITNDIKITLGWIIELTPLGTSDDGVMTLKLAPKDVSAEWIVTGAEREAHMNVISGEVFGTLNGVTTIDTRNDIGLAQARALKQEIAPLYLSGELDLTEQGAVAEFRGDLPFIEFWTAQQQRQIGFFGLVFPDEPLQPGDTWTQEFLFENAGDMRLLGEALSSELEFTREADVEGMSTFSLRSRVRESSLQGVIDEGVQQVEVEIVSLESDSVGTFDFDAARGLLNVSESETTTNIITQMQAPDGDARVSLEMDVATRFERIRDELVTSTEPPPPPADETVTSILANLVFFESDGETVRTEHDGDEVLLAFPLICGHYAGRPDPENLFSFRLESERSFSLDIESKLTELDRASCELQVTGLQQGLRIEPADARFARLATFVRDPQTEESVGGTTFVDADTDDGLILIYFDRPSHLTMVSLDDVQEGSVDVRIGARGAYWMRIVRQEDGYFAMVPAGDVENVMLAVTP